MALCLRDNNIQYYRFFQHKNTEVVILLSQKRIKTVIGGASIIDMMILVIDINKGIQAQTAEVSSHGPSSFMSIFRVVRSSWPADDLRRPLQYPDHVLIKKFSVSLSEKLSALILFLCSTKSTVLKKVSGKRKSKQRKNSLSINYWKISSFHPMISYLPLHWMATFRN